MLGREMQYHRIGSTPINSNIAVRRSMSAPASVPALQRGNLAAWSHTQQPPQPSRGADTETETETEQPPPQPRGEGRQPPAVAQPPQLLRGTDQQPDWSPTNNEQDVLEQLNYAWRINCKKQLKEAAAKDMAWATEKAKEKEQKEKEELAAWWKKQRERIFTAQPQPQPQPPPPPHPHIAACFDLAYFRRSVPILDHWRQHHVALEFLPQPSSVYW